MHAWYRILWDQKYPKQTPAAFKIHYYQPTLSCLSRYYKRGNDLTCLPSAANQIAKKLDHQRDNNFRALQAFKRGTLKDRTFTLQTATTWKLTLANVTIRCTPDFYFDESGQQGVILLDCRDVPPDAEIARTAVELFHHTLQQNGQSIPMRSVEYVHLESDTTHSWKTARAGTIKKAQLTAKGINALWQTL